MFCFVAWKPEFYKHFFFLTGAHKKEFCRTGNFAEKWFEIWDVYCNRIPEVTRKVSFCKLELTPPSFSKDMNF